MSVPGYSPTTDQILDLVEGGVTQRFDRYVFELLDTNGDVIGELTPDLEDTPRITMDTTRSVFRTLDQLMLPASEHRHIDGMKDRCQVWMQLQNGERFSEGIFIWGDDSHPVREWGHEHHSVLVDLSHPFTSPIGKTSGSNALQGVINRALDFAHLVINANLIDVTPSPARIRTPIGWTPDDTYAKIINDHLALIGYYPMHMNRLGRLQMRPAVTDVDAAPAVIIYDDGGRVERDSVVWADDILQAPNEFVVYDSSGEGTPRIGRYRIPASAPHSVENRGFVWRRVEGMQGLADQASADAAAKALATTDKMSTFEWRTWNSAADPRHDVFDIINFYGVHYLEVKWTLDLVPGGRMTHQARRVY